MVRARRCAAAEPDLRHRRSPRDRRLPREAQRLAEVEERVRVVQVARPGREGVHRPLENRDRFFVPALIHELEALVVQAGALGQIGAGGLLPLVFVWRRRSRRRRRLLLLGRRLHGLGRRLLRLPLLGFLLLLLGFLLLLVGLLLLLARLSPLLPLAAACRGRSASVPGAESDREDVGRGPSPVTLELLGRHV